MKVAWAQSKAILIPSCVPKNNNLHLLFIYVYSNKVEWNASTTYKLLSYFRVLSHF